MNNQNQISKFSVLRLFISFTPLLLMLVIPACDNAKTIKDTAEVAEEQNDAKFNNAKEEDAEFMVNAAEISLEEIQLGQLAQTRGSASHVKDLGKMMVTEHQKAFAELQVLASAKQITIPTTLTDDGKETYNNLMNTKASNFDKEYADMMVNGHKDAISAFEEASTDAKDPDIRNWALSTLPSLRQHLDMSIACQKKCEKI